MNMSHTKRSGANASLLKRRPLATPLASAIAAALLLAGTVGTASAQDSGASCNMIGPACDLSTPVVDGKDGPGADYHDNGHPGTTGNPGGDVTADLEDARTLQNTGVVSPLNVVSVGGKGGNGSNADPAGDIIINLGGGWGAAGQNGGNLDITVGSALSGEAAYVPSQGTQQTSGLTLISGGGAGGDGGIASFNSGENYNGRAGSGGDGGTVKATIGGKWTSDAGTGLYVTSQGGNGGGGSSSDDAKESDKSPQGVDACGGNPNDPTCTAGNGNTVNVTVNGTVSGANYGAFIASIGGDGGAGGASDDCCDRTGGAGGNAGAAGNVSATLGSTGIAVASNNGAAFYVASLGGVGGTGGVSNSAGKGGNGGAAGTVNVEVDGNVNTSGTANTYGVLAQSLGGVGGNGGHSGAWFNPISGSGNNGGAANTVSVTGTGAHITTQSLQNAGDNSSGVLAQSIGGGGGVGPDSNGWFAVGGNGGNASNGNTASVSMTDTTVTTAGFNSAAVIAQSIGGGGGKGGDACNASNEMCEGAIVNMTVGGTGGAGGNASDANVAMLGKSSVSTSDKHSAGVQIQSIGGGGGDGGSAYGKVSSLFYGAAISVGGSGGTGGDGGTVNAARTENNGPASQISTSGSDSFGMLGQSIGGGGGNGGAATAKAVVKGGDDYPSQSLAMATGGSGGVAGNGYGVYLQSSGLIATTGGGSAGIVAQSIGRIAGVATASSSATSSDMSLAASLAFGGTGGAAGNGGNAEGMNHGMVVTTGESASGMLVQSIGGGGGNGGAGDAKSESSASVNQGDDKAENTPEGKSVAFSLGSSGSGGAGGSGANATATNTGAIITIGDAAHGIMAQTIGGGGGNAGGAAASTKGEIAIAPQIGGSGGAGGDTWYTGQVNVTNQGTIATFGADANAIIAQSIGGGGGSGGKAATTLADAKSNKDGSNGSSSSVKSTLDWLSLDYTNKGGNALDDYNSMGGATTLMNSLLDNTTSLSALADDDSTGDALDNVAASGGQSDDDNQAKSISLNVAVGGKGGNGGSGGYITVNNTGDVGTVGKMSDAIFAQSVGGGGGKGGAASTATSADYSGSLAIGGSGGGGGNGGEPTVTNSGAVYTMGPLAAGIVAQSIGGGGGIGGASTTTVGSSSGVSDEPGGSDDSIPLSVSLGGNGGSGGIAEAAIVDNSGAIETRGHDSIGIIAQSIAGGGGIVKTLATNLDNAGGSATASSSKDYAMQFKFGGANGAAGNSGAAHVSTTAAITTSGDNSYGILAQSIGGGGGVALGGKPNGSTAADFFGSGSKSGSVTGSGNPNDDGIVNVTVGDAITTSGQGAMGVVAQSIGGGGGIAGDTGWTQQFFGMSGATQLHGSGGAVDVTVASGGSVSTTANNTPAIWAQSIGGGGGRITNKNGAFIGTAGGSGQGGAVDIQIDGSVLATGNSSIGVFAQSNGDASSNAPINVTVGSTGKVQVGTSSAPVNNSAGASASAEIYIDHGGTGANDSNGNPVVNTVTNNGWVYGYSEPNNAIAVYSTGGVTHVFNNAGATMGGDILLTNGGGSGCFSNSGTFNSGNSVTVGQCGVSNSGTIDIQGAQTGTTTISGNYSGDGKLVFDADYSHGTGDRLVVDGTADVSGAVEVRPSTLRKQTVPLMTATGGLTVQPQLAATHDRLLFTTRLDHDANTLYATPEAHFSDQAASLGATSRAVADHLQRRFDRGDAMDVGYNALAKVDSASAYQTALESLSGRALGSVGAFRSQGSRDFVSNLEQGCDADSDQADCAWGRVQAGSASQKETTDALGYNADTQTIEAGVQHELRDGLTLGGAVGYEHSQFHDAGDMGSVKGDGIVGGIGLRYDRGPLEVSGVVDGGYGSYDSQRTVVVGDHVDQATAKPDVWNAGVHLQASYTHGFGNSYIKPFAELRGIEVHGDGYTEQGASPFNLAVQSQSQFSAGGGLGAEWGTTHALANGAKLGFYVNGAVEAGDGNDWTTRAHFADETAADSFTVHTNVPGTYGRVGVGMNLMSWKNVDLSATYSTEFGGGYHANAGVARLAWHF